MMKNYELIKNEFGTVIAYNTETTRVSFPMVDGNKHYEEYKAYQAWVEAGNNPEDFWTRLEAGDN